MNLRRLQTTRRRLRAIRCRLQATRRRLLATRRTERRRRPTILRQMPRPGMQRPRAGAAAAIGLRTMRRRPIPRCTGGAAHGLQPVDLWTSGPVATMGALPPPAAAECHPLGRRVHLPRQPCAWHRIRSAARRLCCRRVPRSRNRWPARTECRRRPMFPAIRHHRGAIRCAAVSNRTEDASDPPQATDRVAWRDRDGQMPGFFGAIRPPRIPSALPNVNLFVLARLGPFVTVPPASNLNRRSVSRMHGRPANPIFLFSVRQAARWFCRRVLAQGRTGCAASAAVGAIDRSRAEEEDED